MTEPTDDALRNWLLGRLPSADAEAFEQRVLGDDAFGTRLAEVETDLLDDLAAGRLAGDDRALALALARFTATPRGRLRWRIARALARFAKPAAAHSAHRAHGSTAGRHARRRRGWIVGAFGAAAAVAVAVVGLNLRAPAPGSQAATITLLADRQRGVEDTSVAVPKDATSVRLQLEVDAAAESERYAIDIEEAGRIVYGVGDLAAHTAGAYRFVEAEVPKRVFANGERVVRVRAGGAYVRNWILRIREE